MATVPGSLFRKILFWMHLSAGVLAGVLIFVMSATGVAMTYERQMIESAARRNHVASLAGQPRLGIDELAAHARAAAGDAGQISLVIEAAPGAPVSVSAGRQTAALLNPYTGEKLTDASADTRSFMSTMRRWHRYMGGESRSLGGILIDYSNLLFVFIIASGAYLWLPAVWRWRTVRGLVFFQRRYINAKVRDFNWHHVFGVWMLVPLFLIAVSGAIISFPWATNLLYAVYGEEAPQRGGGGGGGGAGGGQRPEGARGERGEGRPGNAAAAEGAQNPAAAPRASLQQLFDAATGEVSNWQRITLPLSARGDHVDVQVELQSTERRPPRRTLELSTADARLMNAGEASGGQTTQSPAQRARSWFRFVHTGEEYGVVGQTIAGIASLAACFLVYTGLALAWRRLIRPLYRRA